MVEFYLGTHVTSWLRRYKLPFFVSQRTLGRVKTLHPTLDKWMLDSGGFSELSINGRWTVSPHKYVLSVRRYANEMGNLRAAAVQDWMCEPVILKKTGLTIKQHQANTIKSYLELKSLGPWLPWMPVLQGWDKSDYLRHADMYDHANIDLTSLPIVGVGSVCRRQATKEAVDIIKSLSQLGIKLHGFGVKLQGLKQMAHYLDSADSLAWSYGARYSPPLPGCRGHINCANCYVYAEQWYQRIVTMLKDA